jgi:hypothetical protein
VCQAAHHQQKFCSIRCGGNTKGFSRLLGTTGWRKLSRKNVTMVTASFLAEAEYVAKPPPGAMGGLSMIKKGSGGYRVLSSKGKNLGGPYKTKAEALKRLRQVEFFKRQKH